MTDKITLGSIASFQNDSTAVAQYNANNALITTSINNTLSRDGTTPNQMGAVLDMNSFQILNLAAPSTVNSPVRLVDVQNLVAGGTINVTTTLTNNQNALTAFTASNNNSGGSAAAGYNATNGTGSVTFGVTGINYSAIANIQNRAIMLADAGTSGVAIGTTGASPIVFLTNGAFAGGITSTKLWTIGPNFAPAVNTGGGPILLTINGTVSAPPNTEKPGSLSNYLLHMVGEGSSVPTGINLMHLGTGANVYSGISFHRGDGSGASPSAVLANDVVGHIGIHPRSTTDWAAVGPAYMRWYAGENFDDTHQGTYCTIATTPNGTAGAQVETVSFQGSITKFGGIDKVAPVAPTVSVSSVTAGTSNTAGVNLTVVGSRGTGTGVGGDIIWQIAPAGSTGTSQNPAVEAMRLKGTGAFSIGSPGLSTVGLTVNRNVLAPAASANSLANFVGLDTLPAAIYIDAYNSAAPLGGPQLLFRRAKGTQASSSAVTAGFSLGSFAGIGYGATGYIANGSTGAVVITAGETWTDSTALTYLDFYTTPSGSTTIAQNMRLQGSGGLSVGTTTDPGAGVILANTALQSALIKGGTAASSTLTLESTSGAGTTDSVIFQTGSQVFAGSINTSQQWLFGNNKTPSSGVTVTINKNAASTSQAIPAGTNLQIEGTDTTNNFIVVDSFGTGPSQTGLITLRQSAGTGGGKTAVQSGDRLGFFTMTGYDGTSYGVPTTTGIAFGGIASQAWIHGSQQGAHMVFYTTPNTVDNGLAEAGRFSQSGGLTIGGGGADAGINCILLAGSGILKYNTAPTAVSGAGPINIGSGSTINNRMKVNLAGTDYWIPCSTTAF